MGFRRRVDPADRQGELRCMGSSPIESHCWPLLNG